MSKHSRRRFDDHDFESSSHAHAHAHAHVDIDADDDNHEDRGDDNHDGNVGSLSTYADATQGPVPRPSWVITSADAIDDDLGVIKSGKEADVSLLRRSHGEQSTVLAVKRYRSAHHRMFHRDAGYLEGRRERRSRESRAMATRTSFGRELIAGKWAAAEFDVLSRLWVRGASVPYPVQVLGTELMMEFIGSPDGVAAPRLAQLRPEPDEAAQLYTQMRAVLVQLVDAGLTHGDLSPYNVLVDNGRVVLIDLPQAVDLVGNPQGFAYLRRDCANICSWFSARGVDASAAALERELLQTYDFQGYDVQGYSFQDSFHDDD